MPTNLNAKDVCEPGLDQLTMTLDNVEDLSNAVYFYGRVRESYLLGDIPRLDYWLLKLAANQGCIHNLLHGLAKIRLAIRRGESCIGLLEPLEINIIQWPEWRPEFKILQAQLHDANNNHQKAFELWGEAYKVCKAMHYPIRASTCYHNQIAAESRIHPHQQYFYQYWRAYKLAKEAKDWQTASMALTNLARDYQLVGSWRASLRYISKAIDLFQNHGFRTLGYFMALANRCHIALELDEIDLFKRDLDELRSSTHAESVAALRVLASIAAAKNVTLDALQKQPGEVILATWHERSNQQQKSTVELTELEEKLMKAISQSPKSKFELVEELYQDCGSFFTRENRLKQLIHRLRAKNPKLIQLRNSKYQVAP